MTLKNLTNSRLCQRIFGERWEKVRDSHVVYIGLLLGVAILVNLQFFSFTVTHQIYDNTDPCIYAAFQKLINNPSLYSKDTFIHSAFNYYPQILNFLMAKTTKITGNVDITYFLYTFFSGIVFFITLYLFVATITDDKRTALVAGLLSTFWRPGLGVGSVTGFFPRFIPGSLIAAITPLIFWLFYKWKRSPKVYLFFFFLGLLINIHPISVLHLFMIFVLTYLFLKPSFKTVGKIGLSGVLFLGGAFPFILKFLRQYGTSNQVPMEILKSHFYLNFFLPSERYVIGWFLIWVSLPLLLGLSGILWKNRDKGLKRNDFLLGWFMLATLFICLCIFPAQVFFPLREFDFLRASKYFYLCLSIFGAYFIVWLFSKKRVRERLLGVIIIILINVQPIVILKTRVGLRFVWPGYSAGDENAEEHHYSVFRDLCKWCKENTSQEAVFLIPPRRESGFRVYAERGIVVCAKDGGGLCWSSEWARKWYRCYHETLQAYASPDATRLLTTAKKYKADYIVTYRDKILPLPIVYANRLFIVYWMNPK